MNRNVPLPRKTVMRLPKIKQGLQDGLNYDQIATNCGVKSTQTIDRDMKAWVQSGLFEIWIKTEFVELHEYTRSANPLEAYKEVSKLVGKMITRKVESEHKEEIIHTEKHVEELNVTLRNYEDTVKKVLSRYIQPNNPS